MRRSLALSRAMRRALALTLVVVLLAAGLGPDAACFTPVAYAAPPDGLAVEADDAGDGPHVEDADDEASDDALDAAAFAGKGRRGRSRGPMLVVLRIAEALRLSDEQTIKLAGEFRRVAQQRRELVARRVVLVGKLEEQLGKKPLDDAALKSLTAQLVSIEQDIGRLPEGLWNALQPVLTPEQSARLILLRGKLKQQVDGERKARREKSGRRARD